MEGNARRRNRAATQEQIAAQGQNSYTQDQAAYQRRQYEQQQQQYAQQYEQQQQQYAQQYEQQQYAQQQQQYARQQQYVQQQQQYARQQQYAQRQQYAQQQQQYAQQRQQYAQQQYVQQPQQYAQRQAAQQPYAQQPVQQTAVQRRRSSAAPQAEHQAQPAQPRAAAQQHPTQPRAVQQDDAQQRTASRSAKSPKARPAGASKARAKKKAAPKLPAVDLSAFKSKGEVSADGSTIRTPKKKKTALILCLLLGMVGGHKFYEGKYLKGILYLLTCGFFLIGVVIDLIKILRLPDVYYVEKKRKLHCAKELVVNFRYDIIGRILSAVAGVTIFVLLSNLSLSAQIGWADGAVAILKLLLPAFAMLAGGIALCYAAMRDIGESLKTSLLFALGGVCFFLVAGFIIVWILLKATLNIDLMAMIFGIDQDEAATHDIIKVPSRIMGPDGEIYGCVSREKYSADFVGNETGKMVTIHSSEINFAGRSASTIYGTFRW